MEIRLKSFPLLALAFSAAACVHADQSAERSPSLALAQGACGGCHAVERHGVSPNPEAPPFAAIANSEGLTRETVTIWLRDAHNYPEEMDFFLHEREIDALVDHILSLRDPNYRPAI